MMYRMIYELNNKTYTTFFDSRKTANEAYLALKNAGGSKICCQIQTVDVRFNVGGKAYTYLAFTPHKAGAKVNVPTPEGVKEATVVNSAFRTKAELTAYAKLNGFAFSDYKAIES